MKREHLERLYPFLHDLNDLVRQCLETEPQVLVAVMGNKGAGKTRFARLVRKSGFGSFHPRHIAVIDDHVMSLQTCLFFTRRVRFQPTGVDELRPFMKYLKGKRVVFYVNSTPHKRITAASIVLRLSTDEGLRLLRLQKRYGMEDGAERFRNSSRYAPTIAIAHRFVLDGFLSDQ